MAKASPYRTLTVGMMAVICVAGIVAMLVGIGGYIAGRTAVQRFYFSDAAVSKRLSIEIDSFRRYVSEQSVASTDVTAVEKWNREHRYTQLTIKGLDTTISSSYNGAELMGTESGILVQSGQVATSGMEFAVNFTDGTYSVMVYESSETVIYTVTQVSAIIVGALIFLLIVLLYDQQLTHSIQTLSRQIRQVSQGDLDMKIHSKRRDELGQLALDVDTMRLSIIEKLQREEAAWQANSQLITAISHDVRTPLTALMGYLELLDDEEIAPEDRQNYLQICKAHTLRLKGLTDELFGFFLVFGQPVPDQNIEEFDAAMLLEQILLEQELALTQQGFPVETTHLEPLAGYLRVDLGHLRRIFDNLFSNVRKYADRSMPVRILQGMENGRLRFSISNAIPPRQERVESNKIGLQTCQKLVQTMGGEFRKNQTSDTFTVDISLPLHEKQ